MGEKEIMEIPRGECSARIKSEEINLMRERVDAHLASLFPVDDNGKKINHMNPEQQWVVDPYGDQGSFVGDLDDDLQPNGKGRMEYTDGRIYEGEWSKGQWHGKGKASFSNGDTYEGDYKNDQRHGHGRYEWRDGRVFDGKFHKDQRHGQGVYTWPDGAKYEGIFSKGLRHGYGKYTFRDGSVYEGEWQRGKYHGQGTCRWADGRVYNGDWVAGKAQGYGVETRPDGSIRHDGKWEDDRPVRDNDEVASSKISTKDLLEASTKMEEV